jgi:basic amino acid/polyamine antiporter, APA family
MNLDKPIAEPSAADAKSMEPNLKRVMGSKSLLLFILGDILGAGIYAVTGKIAGQVGGMAWLPFLIAFIVATMTAMAYLELVTKYPKAAGAALYVHKAFGIHFVTFLVAFMVVCSGITSASMSSSLLAANLLTGLDVGIGGDGAPAKSATLITAVAFMILLALINLRGIGESVKFNVVLTCVEISALAIVILIGFYAMATEGADITKIVVFANPDHKYLFVATTIGTAIAFVAMIGFEDSVNMVEETKDPRRIYPRAMLTGLGIAVVIYMLVAVSVIMVLPLNAVQTFDGEAGILLEVVKKGVPGFPVGAVFPFLTVFAVANTALINMLMASRLIYGMARQNVLPRFMGHVLPGRRTPWTAILFTSALAIGLITYVTLDSANSLVGALSGTTAVLLLVVFTIVNVACLVLRRDMSATTSFRVPTAVPVIAALGCACLAGPWARIPEDWIQYKIAGGLLLIGSALWAITWTVNRRVRAKQTAFHDIENLSEV